jgi:uncharacterized RDD family membrane protein YckC
VNTPNWYSPPAAPPGPLAAPPAEVADSATAQYAGFAIRAAAQIIDTIVGFVLGLVGAFGARMVLAALSVAGVVDDGWPHRMGASGAGGLAIGLVSGLLYHTFAEWIGGATLGKLLLGLRVRSVGLGPCTLRGAILRNLAYFVDSFFFGLVAYNSMSRSLTQQRLGDKWGRTVVAKASSLTASQSAGRLAIGIVLGSSLSAATTFVHLVAIGL